MIGPGTTTVAAIAAVAHAEAGTAVFINRTAAIAWTFTTAAAVGMIVTRTAPGTALGPFTLEISGVTVIITGTATVTRTLATAAAIGMVVTGATSVTPIAAVAHAEAGTGTAVVAGSAPIAGSGAMTVPVSRAVTLTRAIAGIRSPGFGAAHPHAGSGGGDVQGAGQRNDHQRGKQ
jgi:hypothetical protein